ncbi:MAG: histidine kinase [Breznakia sp.]
MGSDQLIELLSKVSLKVLPILGLVLLIYVIIFFKALIEALKNLTKTLETTEEQVRKLDKPLATVEDLSQTVDQVHVASKGAIFKGIQIAKDSLDVVKEKVSKKKMASDVDEDTKEDQ